MGEPLPYNGRFLGQQGRFLGMAKSMESMVEEDVFEGEKPTI